ncbi:MAG: precorrin-3B C(17)-methyltransferase [Magnetococcales bacterium]|nr:precorrin-3B C(17)-methyltransferase [Magnetococcales bacterium]
MNRPEKNGAALIAITQRGVTAAVELLGKLPQGRIFALTTRAAGCDVGDAAITWLEPPLSRHVESILASHDPVIFFAALGATVRLIAPHLVDKGEDPAILAIDEGHRHVLPVVSGHQGGANRWAMQLAQLLKARAVITTASDAMGFPAIDILGREWGFTVEAQRSTLTRMAGHMVEGAPLALVQESGSWAWRQAHDPFPAHVQSIERWEDADRERYRGLLWISRNPVPERMREIWREDLVVYRPPPGQGEGVAIGIGCDRGTAVATVAEALHGLLRDHFLAESDIRVFASIDVKRDEAALLALARRLDREIVFFSAAELAAIDVPHPSATVARHVGTPSVAEAAALAVAGGGVAELIVEKACHRGQDGKNVTLAVARLTGRAGERFGGGPGTLYLVGLGPGDHGQLTRKALSVLRQVDCIVGYKTYIKLLGPLTQGKEVVGSAMRQELDRCMEACRRAALGQRVALVSSGDAGVYGMAGPTLEMLFASGLMPRVKVEVIPGITALVSAASRLGAPLTHDFAAISLSDLLTPWEVIENRLTAAAQGDFVTALYNPKSGRRTTQIERAREIFLGCRDPKTPVALVTSAYRDQESIILTDLESMTAHPIGMQTTVLIGNRTTFIREGLMVTPRGYGEKYDLQAKVRGSDSGTAAPGSSMEDDDTPTGVVS